MINTVSLHNLLKMHVRHAKSAANIVSAKIRGIPPPPTTREIFTKIARAPTHYI